MNKKVLFFVFLVIGTVSFLPAADNLGLDSVTSGAEMVIGFFQGRIAKLVGVLMIIAGGFMIVTGRGQQSKMIFASVVGGLGVVLNSGRLIERLFSAGSGYLW